MSGCVAANIYVPSRRDIQDAVKALASADQELARRLETALVSLRVDIRRELKSEFEAQLQALKTEFESRLQALKPKTRKERPKKN